MDTIYSAIIVTASARIYSLHAPSGRRPFDQANQLEPQVPL